MAAWLPQPVAFDSSHALSCVDMDGMTEEQCAWYKHPWHNWYVADWTFALPTVAFFMCGIGIFIISYVLTTLLPPIWRRKHSLWQRPLAGARYLSYRGFRINGLNWNTAPIGILILGVIGAIYFFSMELAPSPYYWPGSDEIWGNSPPLGTRSGWLALACMPFLFATASKTSWITLVTGVSHEKLQIFHRWIAYAFMITALMHTFPFIVWHIRNGDMVHQFTVSNIFEYWTGVVALLFQAWLTFASWGPIRSMGYEFFKAAHFVTAVIFMVIFFWHCAGTLTSWHYFVATAAVYVPCWIYPWLRTIFEYGLGQAARVTAEENGFTKITIPTNFHWRPGQHCFLRFRGFGIPVLTSHPFTLCSLPPTSTAEPPELVFYVRRQGGFTAKLHDYAVKQPDMPVPVLIDGPYGGIDIQQFITSDRVIIIAGGSGAGWMLPFIEVYLRHHSPSDTPQAPLEEPHSEKKGTDTSSEESPRGSRDLHHPQTMHVVLATRDIATRTWFHTTIDQLVTKYGLDAIPPQLSIEVHLTGAAEPHAPPTPSHDKPSPQSASASSSSADSTASDPDQRPKQQFADDVAGLADKEVRGRPDLPLLIREEGAAAASTGQAVSVFTCGPLAMQNDVRNAVAQENLRLLARPTAGEMFLHLEHFSWA